MSVLRIYLRRSKADEGKQEFSLDVQRRGCRDYGPRLAKQLGVKLARVVEYKDDGIAGDDFVGRAGLARLLAETEAGDVVVARDQSRVGRDALEVTLAVRRLTQERGARVFYYVDGSEARAETAIEQFVTYAKGFGAQTELEAIRSRTKEALRDRFRRGLSAGGAVFGYRLERVADGTKLVVLEGEAQVVRRIYALYLAGLGFKAIASLLNSEGVPAPKAGRRGSGSWASGCIREILNREKYRGVYVHGEVVRSKRAGRFGGKRAAANAPAAKVERREMPEWRIVDDVTWYGAQAKMEERRGDVRSPGPAARYPLTSIGRCASCGGSISILRTHRPTRGYVQAYGCLWHVTRGDSVCDEKLCQPREEVENALAEYLQREVFTEAVAAGIVARVRAEVERRLSAPAADVVVMEQELKQLEREKARLIKLAAATDDEDVADEVSKRRRRIAELQAHLAGVKRAPAVLRAALDEAETHVRKRLTELAEALTAAPEAARRVYMALFPEGLKFTPTEVAGRRVWRIRGEADLDKNCVVTPPGIEPGIRA